MDMSFFFMWFGFALAGYAVVGNDSIQTLGTFLSSNEGRPWYVLWAYASIILTFTLMYGWYNYNGDVSYGRLEEFAFIENLTWPYLLPPLVLMLLTRSGIPVSTTFLVLTFFKPSGLLDMTLKSLVGYALAFGLAILIWQVITRLLEKRFIHNETTPNEKRIWTTLQWVSTGFLWGQWLIQDFANIYVYLPRTLTSQEVTISLALLLFMLGYIFYSQGGKIQRIVKAKTNTVDIRSATIIDFLYALILLFFKEYSNVPMSTTWVFIGLLAGREIAIRYQLEQDESKSSIRSGKTHIVGMVLNAALIVSILFIIYLRDAVTPSIIFGFLGLALLRTGVFYFHARRQQVSLAPTFKMVAMDLGKITLGLIVSIVLVYLMHFLVGDAVVIG